MAKTDLLLQMKDVTKSFGSKHVLRGVNLDVKRGESLVVIGGSGSGKSVFLKCILGLLEPDGGSITIDGQDTTHLPQNKRYELMKKFGMLFQNGALFDSMTIWENVAFGLLRDGIKAKPAKEKAIEKLAQVGLEPYVADQLPAELSGGMRKRVALARAICTEPEIVFYDEPTTGLDPIMTDVINELIIKLQKELGITSITITHDMKSAYKVGDNIAMLYNGQIIFEDDAKAIQSSDNPFVQQFINGSAEGPIKMAVHAK